MGDIGAVPAPMQATGDRQPDFLYAGRPVYRCRHCGDRFERIQNLEAVVQHESDAHPLPAVPEPAVRESSILGADGEPILVQETGEG